MFPRHEVTNFPIYKSDHVPICLHASTNGNCDRYGKLFRFEAMWLSQEDCWKVVEEAWNGSMSMEAPSKLEWCASKLTEWAEATFGKIKKRIREAEKELKKLQDTRPDHNMLSRFLDPR
ncbi:Epithelial cell-transforming sequence 2 oncogene-like [Bienertia sinuspersici]